GTFETSKYGVTEKKTLDLKNIKMLGIQTGGGGSVKIKRVYLDDKKPEIPDEPEQGTSVPVSNDCFDLSKLDADLELDSNPTGTSWNPESNELITKANGIGGWKFDTPIDLTKYKFLIVKLKEVPVNNVSLALFSSSQSVFEHSYTQSNNSSDVIVFDIQKDGGYETFRFYDSSKGILDLKNIQMLGLQSNVENNIVKIESIYVTDSYEP
ncbi:hypothetical protein, partial [uncultured Bacteroides sp.]